MSRKGPFLPISIDELVAGGVKLHLDALRISSRIYIADEDAQELFDAVTQVVTTIESALGLDLPRAHDALDNVAADPWAAVST